MAKPTTFATPICIGLTVLAAIGILIGILSHNPIWTMLFLLPTIGYEIYRTEGKSTKLAAWGLLGIFVLELIFIIFNVSLDLAEYLGATTQTVGGYTVPLGDVKTIGPIIMAVLAVVLFVKTWGIYTRWLAGIIIVTSFAIVYIINPDIIQQVLSLAAQRNL